jgi:hypothetical protein
MGVVYMAAFSMQRPDGAGCAAAGWPADMSDEEILKRLLLKA